MDPIHEMEQDFMQYGADLCPIPMFDVCHFDDLTFTEASDGLNIGFPSKPLRGQDMEPHQDRNFTVLLDPDDWMEQSGLQDYQDLLSLLITDDAAISMPSDLPDLSEKYSALVETTEQKPDHTEFTKHNSEVDTLLRLQNTSNVMMIPLLHEQPIKVELSTSPPPCSSIAEAPVVSEIDFSADVCSVEPISLELEEGFLSSPGDFTPLSPEDIEGFLSSPASEVLSPTSPSVLDTSSTVDTASLYSDDNSMLCNTELFKIVANNQLHNRSSPYSRPQSNKSKGSKSKGRKQTASICPSPTELELELMSKKDRKKMQNKNAAIRYRMKKKGETEVKIGEVENLETINKDLHEKVEDLTRQIKYMKELINDVRKARGLPSQLS